MSVPFFSATTGPIFMKFGMRVCYGTELTAKRDGIHRVRCKRVTPVLGRKNRLNKGVDFEVLFHLNHFDVNNTYVLTSNSEFHAI